MMSCRTEWERCWKHVVAVVLLAIVLVPTLLNSSKFEVSRFGFHNLPTTNPILQQNDTHTGSFSPQRKPRLILHVGPSKSATTSLQTDMTDFQHELLLDNFRYAGRYYHPHYNDTTGDYSLNRSLSPLVITAHNMFLDCDFEPRAECCRNFSVELDELSSQRRFDVILSEEPLGNQWKDPEDWLAIRVAIENEWDVNVIVGYRRFYSWFVSTHFQRERLDRSHGGLNDLWLSQGGREKEPLFPKWFNLYSQTYRHTFHILDSMQHTFPVKIINLHSLGNETPTTFLFCDILEGATPNTCQQSRHHDLHPTIINTHTKIPSLYYDSIATAAESDGLVDGALWNRSTVRDEVWRFHELDRGLEPQDLPLDCPSSEETDGLLKFSLSIEAEYMAEFFGSNESVRADHVAGFQYYMDQSIFCWVDTDAVLSQAEWVNFFAPFGRA